MPVRSIQWSTRVWRMPILQSSAEPVSDETLEGWLDDMIYSGDIDGFIRRRAKDVINEDFDEYLQERLEACDDEDEKKVLIEIAAIVSSKLRTAEDVGDGAQQYEARLDKILFTAPNARKELIESNMEEMTQGFIEYIQTEMKSNIDTDSKVVYASILQLIGQTKGDDLLGKDASILSQADSSLGDQFKVESKLLEGGLDTSKVGDRNERILAALMFSPNDILEDVLNNVSSFPFCHAYSVCMNFSFHHMPPYVFLPVLSSTKSMRNSCLISRIRSTLAKTWMSAWVSPPCSRR